MTHHSPHQALQHKQEGNKLFGKKKFTEAVDCYSRAIKLDPTVPQFYTNRALCNLKLQNWEKAVSDCRTALEMDLKSVKAYFFLGQALSELDSLDEACSCLQKAFQLTKELDLNVGDELVNTLRHVKKKRWNLIEEKRMKEEIELEKYLVNLIEKDYDECEETRIKREGCTKCGGGGVNSQTHDAKNKDNKQKQNNSSHSSSNSGDNNSSNVRSSPSQSKMSPSSGDDITLNQWKRKTKEERTEEVLGLFREIDERRQKRDVPDYLCCKISFELLEDPVVTPSGITYNRREIEQHLQRVGHFDPVTRIPLTQDKLIPNLVMKEVVEDFIANNKWVDGY